MAEVKALIQCNLVIAAASCMNLFSGFAYTVGQSCFYKRVNIFGTKVYGKRFSFAVCSTQKICLNRKQPVYNLFFFCFGNELLAAQHFCMCNAAFYINHCHAHIVFD